ncbi:hypothetical protein K443DRAFT_673902 [Laccaria amethystina LaAM-08-1]|uniref:Uncharacterized protein n=1 Tax=Laccaria amethystina LaAM-08-1 TaxID=1095629 RepID=A0A0C9Y9Y9_9AGAR|nr:hypothetical protein K443DRAFT_673902 [Laccaria amethystina LaAM-08-1]
MDEENNSFNLCSKRCTNPPYPLQILECLLKPLITLHLASDNPQWAYRVQRIKPYITS